MPPVVERLLAMGGELSRLAGALHLYEADAGPEKVEELAVLGLLEASTDRLPVLS